GIGLFALARPAAAANFIVNSSADGAFDAAPGDGVCEHTSGLGDCSLTAAVDETNALPGLDTIALPAGNFRSSSVATRRGAGVISGAGPTSTHIVGDTNNTALGFNVLDVTLIRVTVRGGTAVDHPVR